MSFISFYYLITWTRTSGKILNKRAGEKAPHLRGLAALAEGLSPVFSTRNSSSRGSSAAFDTHTCDRHPHTYDSHTHTHVIDTHTHVTDTHTCD